MTKPYTARRVAETAYGFKVLIEEETALRAGLTIRLDAK